MHCVGGVEMGVVRDLLQCTSFNKSQGGTGHC